MKTSIWIILLVTASVMTVGAQRMNNVVVGGKWDRTPIDNASMDRKIAEAAEKYKDHAIVRIAFIDIAFPKDPAEFERMSGYGVLLIAALARDGAELPIKRAYVASGNQEIELTKLADLYMKVPITDSQVLKTFGQYRVDSLFLFPVYARSQAGELRVDFYARREGMKVSVFDGSISDELKELPLTKPTAPRPGSANLTAFLQREYPGYVDQ